MWLGSDDSRSIGQAAAGHGDYPPLPSAVQLGRLLTRTPGEKATVGFPAVAWEEAIGASCSPCRR